MELTQAEAEEAELEFRNELRCSVQCLAAILCKYRFHHGFGCRRFGNMPTKAQVTLALPVLRSVQPAHHI